MVNLCLYWSTGSCGDIINYLITSQGYNTINVNTIIDSNGKVSSSYNEIFLSKIKNDVTLIREWNSTELEEIKKESPFMIGTHRLDQCNFIKNYFKDQIKTIGITYTANSYEKILRNWIKKVGIYDTKLVTDFSKDKILIDKLKEKNLYDEYLVKKFMEYTHNYILKEVPNTFDINLPFELIQSGDLASIVNLLDISISTETKEFFNVWFSKQEKF
jgi:hypothetical protein